MEKDNFNNKQNLVNLVKRSSYVKYLLIIEESTA